MSHRKNFFQKTKMENFTLQVKNGKIQLILNNPQIQTPPRRNSVKELTNFFQKIEDDKKGRSLANDLRGFLKVVFNKLINVY